MAIKEQGESILSAIDSAMCDEAGQVREINNLGASVLNEIGGVPSESQQPIGELSSTLSFQQAGGSSGAVTSPTPELGHSAYQEPVVPEGKREVSE